MLTSVQEAEDTWALAADVLDPDPALPFSSFVVLSKSPDTSEPVSSSVQWQ